MIIRQPAWLFKSAFSIAEALFEYMLYIQMSKFLNMLPYVFE